MAVIIMMGSLLGLNQSYADEHDEVRELMKEGEILPLATILDTAQARHPGHTVETKLKEKHDKLVYEVEILDNKGEVWEMKFDAKTGKMLKEEQED
jgi:uncharacterized membrane protein YkoI